jgi:hypothetical protein
MTVTCDEHIGDGLLLQEGFEWTGTEQLTLHAINNAHQSVFVKNDSFRPKSSYDVCGRCFSPLLEEPASDTIRNGRIRARLRASRRVHAARLGERASDITTSRIRSQAVA